MESLAAAGGPGAAGPVPVVDRMERSPILSTQSPTAAALRAAVMLGFLIAIPVVAICGKSLPDMILDLFEAPAATAAADGSEPPGGAGVRTDADSIHLAGQTSFAPDLGDRVGGRPFGVPMIGGPDSMRVGAIGDDASPLPCEGGMCLPKAPPSEPFLGRVRSESGAPSVPPPAPSPTATPCPLAEHVAAFTDDSTPLARLRAAGHPDTGVRPASWDTPMQAELPDSGRGVPEWGGPGGVVAADYHQAAVTPRSVGPRPEGDRFAAVQDRLRELGATYYLLESPGADGIFRFYCEVAVGGNANYHRCFEASDRDALRAMERVLADVEAWRNGR